jgi:quercetin dioxygenase-like cupin family protein
MSSHHSAAVAFAALLISTTLGLDAQSTGSASPQSVWESDRLRIDRISLAAGETLAADSPAGSVIVFLTADLDGRMPQNEAMWRDPGAANMVNHGRSRFEALMIGFKGEMPRSTGGTPPEVVRASGMLTNMRDYGASYGTMAEARILIRNDRVSVTKLRYPADSYGYVDPVHFHPQDAVAVYLTGGYTWPTPWYYGPDRVRRGDVRIVPGNVYHNVGNAGSDPLEFLLIIPS